MEVCCMCTCDGGLFNESFVSLVTFGYLQRMSIAAQPFESQFKAVRVLKPIQVSHQW